MSDVHHPYRDLHGVLIRPALLIAGLVALAGFIGLHYQP